MRWIEERRKAAENWLGPFLSGLIEGLVAPLIGALVVWGLAEWGSIADPSAALFRDLAQVGAALFVAFAVATAGAAAFDGGNLKDHVNWLGVTCGLGVAGFLGIAAALGMAAFRDAEHAGWLSILGLSWSGTSIGLLGLSVALLPYATYHWSQSARSKD